MSLGVIRRPVLALGPISMAPMANRVSSFWLLLLHPLLHEYSTGIMTAFGTFHERIIQHARSNSRSQLQNERCLLARLVDSALHNFSVKAPFERGETRSIIACGALGLALSSIRSASSCPSASRSKRRSRFGFGTLRSVKGDRRRMRTRFDPNRLMMI